MICMFFHKIFKNSKFDIDRLILFIETSINWPTGLKLFVSSKLPDILFLEGKFFFPLIFSFRMGRKNNITSYQSLDTYLFYFDSFKVILRKKPKDFIQNREKDF